MTTYEEESSEGIYNKAWAIAKIHDMDCEIGNPDAITKKGTKYFALCGGGIKEEGDRVPVLCSTPGKAIELFLSEFEKLVSEQKENCFVVWRRKPELVSFESVEGKHSPQTVLKHYYVHARFCFE